MLLGMIETFSSRSNVDALVSPRRNVRFGADMTGGDVRQVSPALNASRAAPKVPSLDFSKVRPEENGPPKPLSGRVDDNEALRRSQTSASSNQVEEEILEDNPFKTILVAYKILTKPLIHSHEKNDSARYHRRAIKVHNKRIVEFRSTLYADWNFGRRPHFTNSYIARLHDICQKFLKGYHAIEHPQFPANFSALTPRSKEAARKAHMEALQKMQKMIKGVEVTKDALVQQCIADICTLEKEYEENLPNASAPILRVCSEQKGSGSQLPFVQRVKAAFRQKPSDEPKPNNG